MFQLVAVICYLKVFRHQELLTMTLFLHQEAKFSASLNFTHIETPACKQNSFTWNRPSWTKKNFTLFLFSILMASLSQVDVISISAWQCIVLIRLIDCNWLIIKENTWWNSLTRTQSNLKEVYMKYFMAWIEELDSKFPITWNQLKNLRLILISSNLLCIFHSLRSPD